MKDVAKHPWLWERKEANGTRMFYLRARVPKDLSEHYKGEHVKRSLRTKDRREADCLIMTEAALLNEEFERHRRKRDKVKTSDVTRAQLWVMVLQWFRDQDQADLEAWQRLDNSEDRKQARDILRDDLGGFGDLDDPRTYYEIAQEAGELLNRSGIALDPESGAHQYLVLELHNATMELLRRRLARVDGSFDAAADTRFDAPISQLSQEQSVASGSSGQMTLAELIEAFLDDPSGKSREQKSDLGYDYIFRLMKEVIGADRRAGAITREDCRKVQRVLIQMPPNATKRFRSMTLVEASDHAKQAGLEPMAPATINSYIDKMSSFLNWALREEYVTSNPAQRLTVEDKVSAKKKRYPFSNDQLRLIFNAPLYRGCLDDERGYAIPGDQVVRRARFWVPLISLFHGMRQNEICQLYLKDIVVEEGIDCMSSLAEEEDQKAKSEASRRIVPIHRELKKMGFLNYVAEQRALGETKLFPELKRDSRGYYSSSLGKWFARFLVKTGAKTRRTSFHSFRHSWRDALRDADVRDDIAFAIGGWSEEDKVPANYGSGYSVQRLAKENAKVRYDELDLSHLYTRDT